MMKRGRETIRIHILSVENKFVWECTKIGKFTERIKSTGLTVLIRRAQEIYYDEAIADKKEVKIYLMVDK